MKEFDDGRLTRHIDATVDQPAEPYLAASLAS
jgi:hypothetical protein